jgi:hypothetical protein
MFAPRLKRAAMLFNPSMAAGAGSYFLGSFETTARSLDIIPVAAPVRSPAEIRGTISTLARDPDVGLIVVPDQFLALQRALLVTLASQHCLPAMYPFRYFVTEGGLISYGVFPADLYRRSASYVDRILRGVRPNELPVQGPTKFELVINAKTARALGLEIPRALLAQAADVIEWAASIGGLRSALRIVFLLLASELEQNWFCRGNRSNNERYAMNKQRPLSFEQDIKPLFRPQDVRAMEQLRHFNLHKYEDVKQWADRIFEKLNDDMPCDGLWPESDIAKFKKWKDEDGMLP